MLNNIQKIYIIEFDATKTTCHYLIKYALLAIKQDGRASLLKLDGRYKKAKKDHTPEFYYTHQTGGRDLLSEVKIILKEYGFNIAETYNEEGVKVYTNFNTMDIKRR